MNQNTNALNAMLRKRLEHPSYEQMIQISNEEGICKRVNCIVVPLLYNNNVLVEYATYEDGILWIIDDSNYKIQRVLNHIIIYKNNNIEEPEIDDGYGTVIDGYHYKHDKQSCKKYKIENNYIGFMSGTRFLSMIPGSPLYEFQGHEFQGHEFQGHEFQGHECL